MERVFFPFDAELKNELDQIKLAIQGEQNGIAARSMGQMAYKKNYGVPYTSLRKIANQYPPNKKLAKCLWNIGYRETMLIALLLFPIEEVEKAEACSLVADMQELELVEFACRDMLCKLPYANELVSVCAECEGKYAMETAYLLAARLLENDTTVPSFSDSLYSKVEMDLSKCRPTLAKAVSNYLKQLGIFDSQNAKVVAIVDKLSSSDNMQFRWVAEEVRTFVEYTEHKA